MQNIGFITLYSVSADIIKNFYFLVSTETGYIALWNHNHIVMAVPSFCDFCRGK